MADSYGVLSIVSTAGGTEVVANLTARQNILLKNNGTAIVYIGFNNSVTSSNGMPIAPQGSLTIPGKYFSRKKSVFGIAASGTQDLRYMLWDS